MLKCGLISTYFTIFSTENREKFENGTRKWWIVPDSAEYVIESEMRMNELNVNYVGLFHRWALVLGLLGVPPP